MARIGVVGGGTFGEALATSIAKNGHQVLVATRRSGQPNSNVEHTNSADGFADCETIFFAVPSVHADERVRFVQKHIDGGHILVHVSRGLVGENLETVSHLFRKLTSARRVGCLAGPIHVEMLRDSLPGGGVVGTYFPEVTDAVRRALGQSMRIYHSDDLTGVEIASALAGLLALSVGYCLELKFGAGSMSVLLTRGMRECARVGVALGAEEHTFGGVAGFGDLISAVAGDERPEVKLGRALARGLPRDQAATEAGAYIEGVNIARRVHRFAERRGIEVPIIQTMADVLDGNVNTHEALTRLMSRRIRPD